ncbi:upstream stimulatory factor 1-like [Tachysurus fulvidraco]|uniref:upstream stimulatory factor 1-like n=1 Tax=Tachysurus fulvidraco TaxID=1234273 RepID=UPI001FEE8D97|nr:upstream stimulatory factor 1-like [Tachysurus fulvidraco]
MEAQEKADKRQAELELRLKIRTLEIEAEKQVRMRQLELDAMKIVGGAAVAQPVPPPQVMPAPSAHVPSRVAMASPPAGAHSVASTFDVGKNIIPNKNLIEIPPTKMLHFFYLVATAEDPSAITTIQSAATFSSEQPIKYLFKTEGAGGQVTYRVIQVADGQLEAQSDGTTAVSVVAGIPATTQPVTQAVFSQAEALEGDGTETHYTYYPATISEAGTGTMVTGVQASDTILSQGTPTVSFVPSA